VVRRVVVRVVWERWSWWRRSWASVEVLLGGLGLGLGLVLGGLEIVVVVVVRFRLGFDVRLAGRFSSPGVLALGLVERGDAAVGR
jgi:hypothetical protein